MPPEFVDPDTIGKGKIATTYKAILQAKEKHQKECLDPLNALYAEVQKFLSSLGLGEDAPDPDDPKFDEKAKAWGDKQTKLQIQYQKEIDGKTAELQELHAARVASAKPLLQQMADLKAYITAKLARDHTEICPMCKGKGKLEAANQNRIVKYEGVLNKLELLEAQL